MNTVLRSLEHGIDAVAVLEAATLVDEELAASALGLALQIDRLKGLHALLVAEADQRELWRRHGARSVADWLAGTTNTSYGDARTRAALGSAMRTSRKLREAVKRGDLTSAAAEKVADAVNNPPSGADESDVDDLVDAVKGTGPREARQAADRWREICSRESEDEAADRRHRSRAVRFGSASNGMVDTLVRLPERETAELRAVVSSIAGKPCEGDSRTTGQRLADGLVQLCAAYARGDLTGGREGANLLITMSAEAYAGVTDEPAHTSTGERIPAHVARQMAENATVQRIVRSGTRILDLGRTVRFATADQYKALVVRDGGCRWPGCHIPAAWCDIDHLVPHSEGGSSDLDNLVMWCRHHHIEKHRPGVVVRGSASALWLVLPDDTTLHCPPNSRPRTQAAA